MKIHDLAPAPGSTKARRRVGRGIAGKGGKTAGRGTKGLGARGTMRPGFEGGQLPLSQRIPKLKGFKNPFRVEYTVVNLDTLERMEGSEVNPEVLREVGLVHKKGLVKVLGRRPTDAPGQCFCARLFCLRGRPRSRPQEALSRSFRRPSGTAARPPRATRS